MTIDKNTVMTAGEQAAIDALENHSEIVIGLHATQDEIKEALRDLIDDSYNYDAFTVNYYHEAWDIVTDSDFAPSEDVDFSGCTDALDCVMKEARASIDDVVREGWESQIDEYSEKILDLLSVLWKENYDGDDDNIKIKIGRGTEYGYFVHAYETEYCAVWTGNHLIESEIKGVETLGDSNETVFYFSWS